MPTCVIFNPTAKGEKAKKFRKHLDDIGSECAFKMTTGPGAARGLAAKAVGEGYDTVIAAGGDGTLNEVLNGLADAPEGLLRTRLGLFPLGTVNVFAQEMGIPWHVPKAWEIIRRGREVLIDLPHVEFAGANGTEKRRFAQMAGIGWDARAIQLVNWELKKKFGQAAYVVAGVQALAGAKSLITVTAEGHSASGELVLIGNGKFYGGKYAVFHQADYTDGLLDVCVFPKMNFATLPKLAWGILSGRLFKPGGSVYFQAKELTLTSPTPACLQVEGDCVGTLPAKVRLEPRGLRVIVP